MDEYVFEAVSDFADADAAGIAHFSSILKWVERGESEWLASLGTALFERPGGTGMRGFVRASVRVDFRSPMLAGESFAIRYRALSAGASSFEYAFVASHKDGGTIAEGSFTIVRAERVAGGRIAPVRIPDALARLGRTKG
jgi:acyl-CoA thioesterase FadM